MKLSYFHKLDSHSVDSRNSINEMKNSKASGIEGT